MKELAIKTQCKKGNKLNYLGFVSPFLNKEGLLLPYCQKNQIDTYQAKTTLKQAEKMVEGLPLTAEEYLNILNIEGLNEFPPEKFRIVLNTIDVFFKCYGNPKKKTNILSGYFMDSKN